LSLNYIGLVERKVEQHLTQPT